MDLLAAGANSSGWSSAGTIAFLVAGAALLAGFMLRERRTAHPLIDLGRAGEASGVVLTFLVTRGGIGLAGGASIISALECTGHSTHSAQETTLVTYALLSVAASVIVMSIRAYLVRRGLMKPLSMAADRDAAAGPGVHGRRQRGSGRDSRVATCPCA